MQSAGETTHEHVLRYTVETCRMRKLGTVTIRSADPEGYAWENRERARKAMRKRFGGSQQCLHCGEPMVDVHPKPIEERYPFPEYSRSENAELHLRKLSAAVRNRDAAVFRVLNCMGDLLGHVAVLKPGTEDETRRRAERNLVKRFGVASTCECGSATHDLQQVRGIECI